MHLKFQMTDNILIASACGELDHHSAENVRNEIDGAFETFQCCHLILDLEQVTFMDSSGIGVVMGRYNKISQKGGRLFLTGCSSYVEKILAMAGIFTIAEKQESVTDAIDVLKGQEQLRMEAMVNEQ